jgi:NAD(P)-dependent dehydrogenase (short-subunit alcohol dehydrogenase family)
MKNKKVLVIGAGSYSKKDSAIKGIGTCLVERLAKERNLSVLFTYYQSQEGAEKLIDGVKAERPSFEIDCFRFNSLDYKLDWDNLESKLTKFGTPDVFVYNAGLRVYKKSLTEEEKEATMKVNYSCPVFLIEKIGMKMHREGIKGKIVLTSSVLAGKHHPFLEDYCLSKSLLEKYVQENTEIWKSRGINIKFVSPNLTKTPMIEELIDFYEEEVKQGKRPKIVSPEEIAEEITNLFV